MNWFNIKNLKKSDLKHRNMNGIKLCCAFSRAANEYNPRKKCGPTDAYKTFTRFLQGEDLENEVRELLIQFPAMHPYLEFISKENRIEDPLSYDVVEAFWLGNSRLDTITHESYREFLPNAFREIPPQAAEELQKRLPQGAKPSHTFDVLFSSMGYIGGIGLSAVQFCMVTGGQVTNVSENKVAVRTFTLLKDGNLYSIDKKIKEIDKAPVIIDSQTGESAEVKTGDYIAAHWGQAVAKITEQQYHNLEKYTREMVRVINTSLLNH